MFRRLLGTVVVVLVLSVCGSAVLAQGVPRPFPAAALAAKTLAIVNETGNHDVEKGAVDTLRSWGQFRIIDDPEQADITLRFAKTRTHEGASTQKTDQNGKPTDYGYGVTFGSSIHMTASLKDGETSFYSTKTDDSKSKAGMSCVNSFHTAFRNAVEQRAKPQPATP